MRDLVGIILVFALLLGGSIGYFASAYADSEMVKGAKKDFTEFKAAMDQRLQSMEKQILELKDKAKQKGGEAHAKTVAELESARDKLKADLAELKEESQDGWAGVKEKISVAADSLNQKIQKALKDK